MRHIFIINPKAGRKNGKDKLKAAILSAGKKLGCKVEIYETKSPGDGEEFVRHTCEKMADSGTDMNRKIRFYACGGDGALNGVVNGAYGFKNVEIGCIPMGTGNDYIRNYGDVKQFLDIESQLMGKAVDSDLIKFIADENEARYCANMFNIGFDCNVVDQTNKTKKWPLINGSLAYLISIIIILIKKKGANLRVEYETGKIFDGPLLLISIANGCFCGGGIKGLPLAVLNDGLMDVSLIRDIPRRWFIELLPKYTKGTHLSSKKVDRLLDYDQCSSLTVTANGDHMKLCTDGEITQAKRVSFEIVPNAMRFAVPAK